MGLSVQIRFYRVSSAGLNSGSHARETSFSDSNIMSLPALALEGHCVNEQDSMN